MDKSVLLIDDDEAFHYYVRLLFAKHTDINFLSVYDGREALDLLSTLPHMPRIIFLDLNMPVMGGVEFLENWEKKFNKDKTKIIIVTSSDLQNDRDTTARYPSVKGYVVKPDVDTALENHLMQR